ncbi:hypothetical protein [Mesorhizobium sp. ANAO-SY3R2]|uniref:hypothetical protein n=1 Tax=Mesorhizobium sp. ANAO-SY3R2 TaxID=3166644 RepID=UPI003672D2C9
MEPDPFDKIGQLIDTANSPFPVMLVRQLLFRATTHTKVTSDLATAIGRLHITIAILEEVVALDGADTQPKRQDAQDALARLRIICRRVH